MDLIVKIFSFGFVSSVRGQIIYIFSFENMYLKLTCHLPFTRKGFPTGCVSQVAG